MNEAGTLQQVRDFMLLVDHVRYLRLAAASAVVLIHHENKGGAVSGAWEGVGDTLFHVQGQGHGRTRLFIRWKARWSSDPPQHRAPARLGGLASGFTVDDTPNATTTRSPTRSSPRCSESGGTPWTPIRKRIAAQGQIDSDRIRDRLITGGRLNQRRNGHADEALSTPTTQVVPGGTTPGRLQSIALGREPAIEVVPRPALKGTRTRTTRRADPRSRSRGPGRAPAALAVALEKAGLTMHRWLFAAMRSTPQSDFALCVPIGRDSWRCGTVGR